MSGALVHTLVELGPAHKVLADIKETFGLALPDEERAAQIRNLDRGHAMAVAGGLDDLARDFAETRVRLKRAWGQENPAREVGTPGPGRGNKTGVSETPVFSKQQKRHMRDLARVPEDVVDAVFEKAAEVGDVPSERDIIQTAKAGDPRRVLNHVGEVEHYTPAYLTDAAREVMGGIDLDPASNDTAQAWIRARAYYTKDDDGLAREWRGRVWINPPFRSGLISLFATKMCEEIDAGRVTQACWLSATDRGDTRYYQALASRATGICLLGRRVKYFDALRGKETSCPFACQVLYFGADPSRFLAVFSTQGVCWRREVV